ncbi:hypothetical protein ADUPG1_007067 [Aduncisulcus paluster]|uniref:Uncharacterized protein n=1 Tax=Aduncisulcus paluster TaxID=2918883 RepID=A0ABQ5KP25_9EUKA|nr:hypothetical protein ADUPG1_007067 [Aduncisulcus paluster]|eukprot:gnl/Carplike_NY0171/3459_a4668_488.p1 GENE.gnl/Carplike_NY0171/3459_a4668_488~~gnl/Carplike_NY0171/3459_a4668_488.p1  ORF type:complete len:232 (-),score=67.92 gnl/Carplike_NY0171/3459_a4668_488:131-826(-)
MGAGASKSGAGDVVSVDDMDIHNVVPQRAQPFKRISNLAFCGHVHRVPIYFEYARDDQGEDEDGYMQEEGYIESRYVSTAPSSNGKDYIALMSSGNSVGVVCGGPAKWPPPVIEDDDEDESPRDDEYSREYDHSSYEHFAPKKNQDPSSEEECRSTSEHRQQKEILRENVRDLDTVESVIEDARLDIDESKDLTEGRIDEAQEYSQEDAQLQSSSFKEFEGPDEQYSYDSS